MAWNVVKKTNLIKYGTIFNILCSSKHKQTNYVYQIPTYLLRCKCNITYISKPSKLTFINIKFKYLCSIFTNIVR